MAFPKQSFFGVRLAVPKQHVKKVRQEIAMRARPVPGEDPQELARRVTIAFRAMGFSLTSPKSTDKKSRPAGIRLAPKHRQALEVASVRQSSAIGEQASNHVPTATSSAIGEKASNSVPTATDVNTAEAVDEDISAPPTVRVLFSSAEAPWTLHDEQGVCFRAKEELGRGTFGKVFGGAYGPSDEAVAVKVLSRNPARKDCDVDAEKEVTALKHLVHPCIVRFFGVILTTFNVQLFLQWHEMSLRRYLARKPAEAEAKQVALCILKGLAHMHAANYVHRDLKPDNILVDRQPLAAVISDLGSAHLGQESRKLVTTLFSRAPELMLGYSYGKASDVWSLGSIFAQMEQRAFFDELLIESGPHSGCAQEFIFMRGVAMKVCPRSASALKFLGCKLHGLSREVLKLGKLEAGVVGARFSSRNFQTFMEQVFNFQPPKRATAQDLLEHPWLQTSGFHEPLG